MEKLSKRYGDSYSVSIRNKATHIATFSFGFLGFMKIPITTVKPTYYKNNDINTLIQSLVHTNYCELTEPFNVYYQDMK